MRGAPGAHPTALVVILAILAPPSAFAQDAYPTKPVRIIVPTAPGGTSDTSARIIAQELTRKWGKAVVAENRAGAGTIVGSEMVAKSAPDGYTLLVTPSTLAINPASYKKMPYDGIRDFAPITQSLFVPNLIVVHPSLPAKSIRELIALAKARPGEIVYGSAGHGTNPHLTTELFTTMAGIRLLHVPYKGSLPGIVDLLGGRLSLMSSSSWSVILPNVRAGKLRALAVTSATRAKVVPEIPTVAESGVPGYESVQWSGVLAPARTPRDIIALLNREMTAILRAPEARERLASESAEVIASSPEEFAKFIKSETTKWAKVARAAGIKPE